MRTILKVTGVKKLSNISKDFSKRYPNLSLIFFEANEYRNGVSNATPYGKEGTHLRLFKISELKPYNDSLNFSDIADTSEKSGVTFEIELDDYITDSDFEYDEFYERNIQVGFVFNKIPDYVHIRKEGSMTLEKMNELNF